jgi:polygalacturonase
MKEANPHRINYSKLGINNLKAKLINYFLIILTCYLVAIAFPARSATQSADPVTYKAPDGAPVNKNYKVQIREKGDSAWKTIDVNDAMTKNPDASGHCGFVYFDSYFKVPVQVKITKLDGVPGNVAIRPNNDNIKYTKSGSDIYFEVARPQKLSVEFDKDRLNNFFLFANQAATKTVNSGSNNVIYFGPGIHHAGAITLSSNQTLYIDGGAVVYGYVYANKASNIKIAGRGILDGSELDHDLKAKNRIKLINLHDVDHVSISGIILRDSPFWTCSISGGNHVDISDIKELCYNPNSDGFDLCNSNNVSISDVLIRNGDDNISVKSFNNLGADSIKVTNSILWADRAHNMVVGPESRSATLTNIVFDNIDVLENMQNDKVYPGVMAIMAADGGTFSNITWNNIRVNDISDGQLICIQYVDAYSKNGLGKKIQNVTIQNVTYTGRKLRPSKISGMDNGRNVDNVVLKNIMINKKALKDTMSGDVQVNPSAHLKILN